MPSLICNKVDNNRGVLVALLITDLHITACNGAYELE